MRRKMLFAASGMLALMMAAGAQAQSAQSLSIGATVDGAIEASDVEDTDNAVHYDAYAFTARAGQRLEFVARSEAFDTFLEVRQEGAADILASDDDGLGDGTTNSRLRFTPEEAGSFVLWVKPLAEGEGAYSLTMSERPAAGRAPRPSGIRLGQTVQGSLVDGDPETDEGVAYDAWAFRARQGDRFTLRLNSEAFDPVVVVGRMNRGSFEELASNDDGPNDGLNSRLTFTAPSNGEFVIRATALSDSGGGAYDLSLEEGPAPIAAQPLTWGEEVRGELTAEDGESASGGSADAYSFSGREGQRVRIDMKSNDFDTFLELFDADRNSLATDDDGSGDGTDSRLTFTLPRTGDYVIEARSFSEGTGDYRLTLSEVEPEKAPEPIAFGASFQGEIGEGDSRDDSDRGFDGFVFSGREGQRVQAVMRSGDFDTFLQIGKAGGTFEALASDDDGLGEGTDSRLNFLIPEDGDYVLRASPLSGTENGLYALELIDRGAQPKPGSILVGATARATLSETDATADDNSFYDAYRVDLKADEKLVITMVSNDFDAFVAIGEVVDNEAEMTASDDDSLSDTHAKLEFTAPEDGTYEIRAGSFGQGQTGAYALTVDKAP